MKTPPPTHNPYPYRSPLWRHVRLIQKMVKEHATWKEIAAAVGERGHKCHFTNIQKFYNRLDKRERPLPPGLRQKLDDMDPKPRQLKLPIKKEEVAPLEEAL